MPDVSEHAADIVVDFCQDWIRHTSGFFSCSSPREHAACDMDEVLWPDPAQRREAGTECQLLTTLILQLHNILQFTVLLFFFLK